MTHVCPECELPAPGTADGSRCCACSAERVAWAARAESGALGYPVTEQGPCADCREPTHRYGDGGRPLCAGCEAELAARTPEPAPAPVRAPEVVEIPEPVQAELELAI